MPVRRAFAAVAAAVVALPLVATASSTAAGHPVPSTQVERSAAEQQRIAWGRCESQELRQLGARCALLAVPLDHDDPSGPKIRIAISRLRHTVPDAAYQGIMLVNPGGPGGSGLEFARYRDLMPDRSGHAYDWIGFDPRGVGSSRPSIGCKAWYYRGPVPPEVPTTRAIMRTWLAKTKQYADACAKHGALLDHLRTEDHARDMDLIREALGEERLSFYGWSYGSYLGQVYATLYPDRVHRMVLDSNVDPDRIWYQLQFDQNAAFERVLRRFFRWVARHHAVYELGRTAGAVERRFYREQRGLARDPARGVLGSAEWSSATTPAMYLQVLWPVVATGLSDWANRRDPGLAIRLWRFWVQPGDDNLYANYLAVSCTDDQMPTRWQKWKQDHWRSHRSAPFASWGNAWFNAPCRHWPGRVGTPVPVTGNGVGMLLVGQTLDAATPHAGNLAVRRLFPGSRLIAVKGGTTHAGSPTQVTGCVLDPLAAYLRTGALPPRLPGDRADVRCAPLPLPSPELIARRPVPQQVPLPVAALPR